MNYFARFIVVMMFCICGVNAQTSKNVNAFGVGERLIFDMKYGFIKAGEAVMGIPAYEWIEGNQCMQVQFTVRSSPSFSFFFEVVDRYETYLDVNGIYPWRFEQHIREGKYRRDFSAIFDQKRHVAKTTEGNFPIPPNVHDILSAFYYARTLDYSKSHPGDKIMLQNFYKDKTYPLAVKFVGRQSVDVSAGVFNCIIVEPLVQEGGLFKSEGRILLWMTDDDRKMPVQVSTKVLIGSITAELREYYGLTGPVNAKTD
ncbi:MAG TPA: DUF3108 domain-containing protein [Bacteroidota bacterium]|nr:DUF3108 domain-containing protein [Bacteroidota bacterium]